MKNPVLLVIDMLNDFLDSWPSAARDRLLRSTNDLIALMRAANHPVICPVNVVRLHRFASRL